MSPRGWGGLGRAGKIGALMILGGAFVVGMMLPLLKIEEVVSAPLLARLRLAVMLSAAAASIDMGGMGLPCGGVVDGDDEDVERGISGREIAIGIAAFSMFRGVINARLIDERAGVAGVENMVVDGTGGEDEGVCKR